MENVIRVLCVFLRFYSCSGVIYHLNDTEHGLLPPLYAMDEYDSCLVEESGKYCLLQLTLSAEPGNKLMHVINEYSDHVMKHYNHSIIERGVCVTKTCQDYITDDSQTREDIVDHLGACLNDSLHKQYGLSARVTHLFYCDKHNETRYIDFWDWVILGVMIGLVVINIAGTIHDYFLSKQNGKSLKSGNQFLLCFSVTRNWKRLTNTHTNDPRIEDLQFLNGYRVLLNLLSISMHATMSYTMGYSRNIHDIEKAFENPYFVWYISGMVIVQYFFCLSGFLAVYYLLLEEQKRAITVWDAPRILVNRLVRVVPALAMAVAVSATWARHAGAGPLWRLYVADSLAADCRKHWWRHLLFLNNYAQDTKVCLIPTWHLAAEIQVFAVCACAWAVAGPRRARVLGGLLLAGVLAAPAHTLLQDLDVMFVTPQAWRSLDVGGSFWLLHAAGHVNLPCFIIGMFTATRLFSWQRAGTHRVNSKFYSVCHYFSLLILFLVLGLGSGFYRDAPRASLGWRVLYAFGIRLALGIAAIFSITVLFMKTPSYLKLGFEWRGWVVASRLSYSVFLLHMVVTQGVMGSRTQLTYFSFYDVTSTFLFIVAATYLIAVPFSLMVEVPFLNLFKNLANNRKQQSLKKNKKTSKHSEVDNRTSDIIETSDKNGASDTNETSNINGTSSANGASSVNGTSGDNETIKKKIM